MTSRKGTKNKFQKFIRNKSRNNRKSRKNSSKKLQIAGGKEEIEKQLRQLNDEFDKLRQINRVNPNDHNDSRMRFVQEQIDKLEFQLKTPEEQQAILEQRRISSVAAKQRQIELEEQREINRKEQEARKLEQMRVDAESLKRSTTKMYDDARLKVIKWEMENLSRLQTDKQFVHSELHRLTTQYENITADGQPKGATAMPDYPIWYQLMRDLLYKYF